MKFSGKVVALIIVLSLIMGSALTYSGLAIYNREAMVHAAPTLSASSAAGDSGLQKVQAIADLIQQGYFKKVSKSTLYNGAIKGMIDSLNDPFSDYMDPKTAKGFEQSLSSSFQGIGAEVKMDGNNITIVSPYKGSPAAKAGLRPKDQILDINGKPVKGLTLSQAVLKIRGKKGTKVKLTIKRPSITKPINLTIVRDNIPLKTVYTKTIKKDNETFGYIQITTFSNDTAKEFKTNLSKLEKKGIDGLVIDVRGNPGGLLDQVEKIADLFITDKKPIVQIEDRNGKKHKYYSKLKTPKPYPIVDLIDGGSASAAEILSGALNEAGGYPLVGMKSFGKGTVQQTYPFKDGSTFKMTMFKWLTPDGNWIHHKGIKPTIEVKQPGYFYTSPITLKSGQVLKYDMNNSEVANVQKMLKGLGYSPGRTDGYYSMQTETAVKTFQREKGLTVNGEIDKQTAAKLQTDVMNDVASPKNDKQLQVAVQTLLKEAK